MKAIISPETKMKDSEVEYIGKIPIDWGKCRLKNVCTSFNSNITTNIINKECGEYKIFGASGLAGYIEYETMKNEYLGIVKDGAGVGRINSYPSHSSLLGTLAYIVPNAGINMNWVKYIIQNMNLGESIDKTTIPHIYFSSYGNNYIPFPSLPEQQVIADYLDNICSKIDEIIAEAKASIDEYKELKQSVIFEAVTKGLDKSVEFIDSGDEWLGKYPKSYNIGQLSMLSNIVRGGSPRPAGDPRYYGGNISFMRISDITKDDNIYVNSCENTITEEGLTRTRMIPPNTLLLTNSGATLGVPKINTFETAFNDGIAAFLDFDERLNIVYVYFFLKARTSYFLECASMGMGQPNLNTDIIGRTKIVFPTLVEQQKVVSYLEDRCGKLNSLIAEKESLINDLEAYKKSLIYEVVTGKRRVV